MRYVGLLAGSLLLVCLTGCQKSATQPTSTTVPAETYFTDPESLAFDISTIRPDQEFIATYASGGKTARFWIQLDPAVPSPNANFAVAKGRFLPEKGSDAGVILADLAKVLEATKIPKNATRAESVSFEYVILSEKQSKTKESGFSDTPPGNWVLLKLFFGNDEGEVYLNLNSVLQKGEFSIKDSDYGNYLIAQMAKVF